MTYARARTLWIMALLVAAASLVIAPFLPWALLSLWLGLYAQKIHTPLTKRLGDRSGLAAVLTVSLLLVIALPIAAVITSIIFDVIALVQSLLQSDQAQAMLTQLVQGERPDSHRAGEGGAPVGAGAHGPPDEAGRPRVGDREAGGRRRGALRGRPPHHGDGDVRRARERAGLVRLDERYGRSRRRTSRATATRSSRRAAACVRDRRRGACSSRSSRRWPTS